MIYLSLRGHSQRYLVMGQNRYGELLRKKVIEEAKRVKFIKYLKGNKDDKNSIIYWSNI